MLDNAVHRSLRPSRRVVCAAVAATLGATLFAAPAQAHGANTDIQGYHYFLKLNDGTSTEFEFGRRDDQVVFGDWNGDGTDTVLVRRGTTTYVTNSNKSSDAEFVFEYGREGDEIIAGDWNGDGKDSVGVRRGNTFLLRNSLTDGGADITFTFGRPDDTIVVGDFDGDGRDSIAIYRDGTFYIDNSLNGGNADQTIRWGESKEGVFPLAGNFDGRPGDQVAYQYGRHIYVRQADGTPKAIEYGRVSGDRMFVGDWEGDGIDNVGVRRYSAPPPAPVVKQTETVSSSAARDARVKAATDYAVAQVNAGLPYVWGTEGPNSFDCSGLTMRAFQRAGINLPRVSTQQRDWAQRNSSNVTKRVSEARPGDLMFGRPAGVNHVAIYLGNGKMAHASDPSRGLKIDNVTDAKGYTFYRIIK